MQHKSYLFLTYMVFIGLIHTIWPAFAEDITQKYPLPEPLAQSDFITFDAKQAQIGQWLFYDKILSGNRNISCSTCHHPKFGTSDGVSLGLGEGGIGLGPERISGINQDRIVKRIPRNAPALWNLGAKQIETLFHDGRISKSDRFSNAFNSPAKRLLPKGLKNIVATQALFPLTSRLEMAGDKGENDVADALHDRVDKAWPIIANRVASIDEYSTAFISAFDHIDHKEHITIVDIAHALSAFIISEWQSIDAPFDDYLKGNQTALTKQQKNGLELFYGKANCASCHAGPLQTDQKFHALAIPPFGPGRTRAFDPIPRDLGRMSHNDKLEDAYKFRTPSLRNVTLTAPYGHNGAYPTLEGIIRHHLDPKNGLATWQKEFATLPKVEKLEAEDFIIHQDKRELKRLASQIDIQPVSLNDTEISNLIMFLHSLTGQSAHNTPFGIPDKVPSGLAIDR